MATWLTVAEVAEHFDVLETDPRLISSTAAVTAAVEERRTDLDFTDATTVPAHVREGAKLWAGLLFQQRGAPNGFAGYGEDALLEFAGARRGEIMKMIGWRRPVVA